MALLRAWVLLPIDKLGGNDSEGDLFDPSIVGPVLGVVESFACDTGLAVRGTEQPALPSAFRRR